MLLTNLAVRMRVQTMYFSADSNEDTVMQRVIALLSNTPLAQVEANLGDEGWRQFYDTNTAAGHAHIDWQFSTSVGLETIGRKVSAHTEIHGRSPKLIILDNLRDAVDASAAGRGYGDFEEVQTGLRELARRTGAHVASLHHATGEYENGDKMIPLGGVEMKLSKIPEQVFSLWRTSQDEIGVHSPKNRSGAPLARATLHVDLSTATVHGYDN